MKDLLSVTKTQPINGRFSLVRSDEISAFVPNGAKVCLLALEKDYLLVGIKIKETLENHGVSVVALSLDSADSSGAIKDAVTGCDYLVSVGGRAISDLSRRFCNNIKLIFVPTELTFYYAFSPLITVYDGGFIKKENAKLADKVVFCTDILKRFRLRHVTDGLSMVAASFLWKAESYDAVCDRKTVFNCVDGAYSELKNLSQNAYESLIKCQLWLANAVYNLHEIDFYADRYMAEFISIMGDYPYEECRFLAAEYVARFYDNIVKKDVSVNLLTPDYNKTAIELADFLKTDALSVYQNYSPLPENVCRAKINKASGGEFAKLVAECLKRINICKAIYNNVYKGRRKRLDLDKKTALKSFRLASAVSGGLIKAYADSGVTELTDDI